MQNYKNTVWWKSDFPLFSIGIRIAGPSGRLIIIIRRMAMMMEIETMTMTMTMTMMIIFRMEVETYTSLAPVGAVSQEYKGLLVVSKVSSKWRKKNIKTHHRWKH